MRYIRIISVDVEPMPLIRARIISHQNLRPDNDPKETGYFIRTKDSSEWLTEEEFRQAHFINNEKEIL